MNRYPRGKSRRGATAVEFAITFPLLMFILFGSYELSRANMMVHTAEAAAYEGARVAIIPGATADECEAAARSVLASIGVRNARVRINPQNLNDDSTSVRVTVTFRFRDNSLLTGFVLGNNATVKKSCELQREIL